MLDEHFSENTESIGNNDLFMLLSTPKTVGEQQDSLALPAGEVDWSRSPLNTCPLARRLDTDEVG